MGPLHIYCSAAFESQFGRSSAGVLRPGASRAADDALRPGEIRTFQISGVSRALVEMAVDAVDTKRAFT